MAEGFVLTDAHVTINGVDLSDAIRQVTVDASASDEEFTAMGALGKARKAGLRDDMFEFELFQDFATSSVAATLFPLVGAPAFPITVRATSAAVSATNPSYEGTSILTGYGALTGNVGTPLMTTVSLPVDGVITQVT